MIMRRTITISICLAVFAAPMSALACSARDVAALKTATLHQRLTVAALTCKSAPGDYNRFVLSNRAALQRADADLKAYFTGAQGEQGEAAYDTYKTKAANIAARGPAADRNAFCAAAAEEFAGLAVDGLEMALAAEALPAGHACSTPMLARKEAPKEAPMRVALSEAVIETASGDLPTLPYSAAPPPVARMMPADDVAPEDIIPRAEYDRPARMVRDVRSDPDAPRYPAITSRRGERYWYYRSLYARPGAEW